jgi:hypothetical protein
MFSARLIPSELTSKGASCTLSREVSAYGSRSLCPDDKHRLQPTKGSSSNDLPGFGEKPALNLGYALRSVSHSSFCGGTGVRHLWEIGVQE